MTPTEFQAAFPEFAAVDPAIIQRHIDAADPEFNVDRWGDKYAAGLGNYVAHYVSNELRRLGIAIGAASSRDAVEKQVGTVRIRRSEKLIEMEATDPFFGTEYGREYSRLLGLLGMGALAL